MTLTALSDELTSSVAIGLADYYKKLSREDVLDGQTDKSEIIREAHRNAGIMFARRGANNLIEAAEAIVDGSREGIEHIFNRFLNKKTISELNFSRKADGPPSIENPYLAKLKEGFTLSVEGISRNALLFSPRMTFKIQDPNGHILFQERNIMHLNIPKGNDWLIYIENLIGDRLKEQGLIAKDLGRPVNPDTGASYDADN